MKTASLEKVGANLSEFVKHARHSPVVVTRDGHPVAMLLGVADDEELERLILAHNPRFTELLDAAERRIAAGEGIPHEQFWREVEAATVARDTPKKVKKRAPRPVVSRRG